MISVVAGISQNMTTTFSGITEMTDLDLRAIKPWDTPDSWVGKPWHGWYVGLARTRDSDVLTESNFEVFLAALRALPEVLVDDTENASQSYRTLDGDWSAVDSVFVVQESHWACGWLDWIAIHPSNEAALKLADEMLCALSDYPVLDDEDLSRKEDAAVLDWWERESLGWRIDRCRDNNESIFAARWSTPPGRVYDDLRDHL